MPLGHEANQPYLTTVVTTEHPESQGFRPCTRGLAVNPNLSPVHLITSPWSAVVAARSDYDPSGPHHTASWALVVLQEVSTDAPCSEAMEDPNGFWFACLSFNTMDSCRVMNNNATMCGIMQFCAMRAFTTEGLV